MKEDSSELCKNFSFSHSNPLHPILSIHPQHSQSFILPMKSIHFLILACWLWGSHFQIGALGVELEKHRRGSWSGVDKITVVTCHLVINKREYSCPKSMCLHVCISKFLSWMFRPLNDLVYYSYDVLYCSLVVSGQHWEEACNLVTNNEMKWSNTNERT